MFVEMGTPSFQVGNRNLSTWVYVGFREKWEKGKTELIFFVVVERGSHSMAQADLELVAHSGLKLKAVLLSSGVTSKNHYS